MSISEVSICNTALAKVGAKTITLLTDNSKEARLCNDLYPKARDFMLSYYHPSFARKRVQLTVDGTAPAWGFTFRYALPADYLALLFTEDEDIYPRQIENGYILINKDDDLNIIYIYRVTATTLFTAEFDEALAFYLASQLAEPLTQNTKKAMKLADEAETWGMRAKFIDSRASSPVEQNPNEWLNSRFGSNFSNTGF